MHLIIWATFNQLQGGKYSISIILLFLLHIRFFLLKQNIFGNIPYKFSGGLQKTSDDGWHLRMRNHAKKKIEAHYPMLYYHQTFRELREDRSTRNYIYCSIMNAIFFIEIVYILKIKLSLNFQMVTATSNIIFEMLGSMQDGKDVVYILFLKFSQGYKRKYVKCLPL